jgi:uncharacterized protein with HEPN domain
MDKSSNLELIEYILKSISIINRRFTNIKCSDDFLDSDSGIDMLDSISMRLQSIGEAIKNIDKRDRDLLLKVESKLYWSKIIKAREILTHHYIDIDSEIIYSICKDNLKQLEINIIKLKAIV